MPRRDGENANNQENEDLAPDLNPRRNAQYHNWEDRRRSADEIEANMNAFQQAAERRRRERQQQNANLNAQQQNQQNANQNQQNANQNQQNLQNQPGQQNQQNQPGQQNRPRRQNQNRPGQQNQPGRRNPNAPARNQERRNPFEGTVNKQENLKADFLKEQAEKIRVMRYMTREVTFGARRGFSSPEFRKIKQDIHKLDAFLKKVNGRTALTKEEMEKYEELTMAVDRSTQVYLNKKKASLRARTQNGKVTLSAYEYKRILAIKDIQGGVRKFRQDMYDKDLQKKKEEMAKRCQEKIDDMQDTLKDLYYTQAGNNQLKPALENAVTHTLFSLNRMDSVKKSFQLKPGESFRRAERRLNRDLNPTQQDLEDIRRQELTQKIVTEGMKMIRAGKEFTVDDIKRIQKRYLNEQAERIQQNRRRNELVNNPRRNNSFNLGRPAPGGPNL